MARSFTIFSPERQYSLPRLFKGRIAKGPLPWLHSSATATSLLSAIRTDLDRIAAQFDAAKSDVGFLQAHRGGIAICICMGLNRSRGRFHLGGAGRRQARDSMEARIERCRRNGSVLQGFQFNRRWPFTKRSSSHFWSTYKHAFEPRDVRHDRPPKLEDVEGLPAAVADA